MHEVALSEIIIRQIVLGHSPSTFGEGALGMTSRYTHPRPETIKREVEKAVRLWPAALDYSQQWLQGGESC
ncbi:MAG: hypothetical protein COA78_36920 [Blastopirellula sp.]|nr:MAG: hypothetical protein COA78_36920 [Blastopirellula sp.]